MIQYNRNSSHQSIANFNLPIDKGMKISNCVQMRTFLWANKFSYLSNSKNVLSIHVIPIILFYLLLI